MARTKSIAAFLALAALAALAPLLGCGGDSGPAAPILGSLAVTSDPPGASVFLNGAPSGKITDGTISVTPGTYTVSVKKPGYADQAAAKAVEVRANETASASFTLEAAPSKRVVLVDHFSNTSCEPCFEAENNLEAALHRLGLAVSYSSHLGFPAAGDPFYVDNAAQSNERKEALQISYMPQVWVDGVHLDEPSDFDMIVARIEAAAAVPPAYQISVTKMIVGDTLLVVRGTIRKTAPSGNDDVFLIGVIETGIRYPAANGIDHYDDIVRGYLPVASGDPFTLAVGNAVEFQNSLRIKSNWVAANLEAIASVQSASTRVVYQTATTR